MIIFKLLALLVAASAALLNEGLETKWRDRKIKQHRRIRKILLGMMAAGVVITAVIVVFDNLAIDEQSRLLLDLQQSTEKQILAAEEREQRAMSDREAMAVEIKVLTDKLDGFLQAARTRYPGEESDIALAKILQDIRRLDSAVTEVQKKTEPPKLSIGPTRSIKTETGYEITIELCPSNALPTGEIHAEFVVLDPPVGRITAILPDGLMNWGIQTQVAKTGKHAAVSFTPQTGQTPGIKVSLSHPAVLLFFGSHGLEPVQIEIK